MAANISNTTYCPMVDTVSFSDYSLIVAIPILVLLSFLESRDTRGCCRWRAGYRCRRPGLLVPVNFLDTGRNRWAYAITLGASTNMCVTLFNGSFGDHFNKWFQIPDNDSKGWIQQLIALVSAIEVGLVYFPFLACLKTRYKMVGVPFGLCYSIMWFVVYILEHLGCLNNPTFIAIDLETTTTIPGAICHLILVGKFAQMSVYYGKAFWKKGCHGLVDDDTDKVAQDSDFLYVQQLVTKKPTTESEVIPWYWRYFRKYTHADNGIRFSARMTTTMIVSLLSLYSLATIEIEQGTVLIEYIRRQEDIPIDPTFDDFLHALKVSWIVSGVIALIIHIVYIFVIMVYYRKHMRALYRGDTSWVPSNFQPSTADSIYSGLKYSGTQIAFILWGFIIQQATFLLICGAIYGLSKNPDLIVQILKYIGPILGVTTVTLGTQMLLSTFVFPQKKINPDDKSRPLAIDNRKFYHITSYFLFFFNVMIGLFTSLLRVLLGGFIGGMTQARIDRSVFMRGFENWDIGFKSYLDMLRIEVFHNHPVLLVFCQRLLDGVKGKHEMWEVNSWGDDPQLRPLLADTDITFKSSDTFPTKRSRFKWLVMYTICRNPTIIGTRRYVLQMEENERDHVYRFLAERILTAKTTREHGLGPLYKSSENSRVKSLDRSYGTMRETEKYRVRGGLHRSVSLQM